MGSGAGECQNRRPKGEILVNESLHALIGFVSDMTYTTTLTRMFFRWRR